MERVNSIRWINTKKPVNDPRILAQFIYRNTADHAKTLLDVLERRHFSFDINAPVASYGTLLEAFVHYADRSAWRDRVNDFVRLFVECGGQIDACINTQHLERPLAEACAQCKIVAEMRNAPLSLRRSHAQPFICKLIEALINNGAIPTDDMLNTCILHGHVDCAKCIIVKTRCKLKAAVAGFPADHWVHLLLKDVTNTADSIAAMIGSRKLHRSPVLAPFPRDVLLLVAKMIWRMRYETETWQ